VLFLARFHHARAYLTVTLQHRRNDKKRSPDAGRKARLSDALKSYEGLQGDFTHQVIDHAVAYVDGQVHTNGRENFWSLLKRGLNGAYVSVEPFLLFRYLDEQAFRYNNREDMDDSDRLVTALSQITGKRLTHEHLTGKDREPNSMVI
jgi:hypothetical protein